MTSKIDEFDIKFLIGFAKITNQESESIQLTKLVDEYNKLKNELIKNAIGKIKFYHKKCNPFLESAYLRIINPFERQYMHNICYCKKIPNIYYEICDECKIKFHHYEILIIDIQYLCKRIICQSKPITNYSFTKEDE